MSSTIFEVVLLPDRGLQRLVRGSGILLMAAGVFLVMQMPFAHYWRLFLVSIWLAECWREQRNLRSGASRVCAVTLSSRGDVVATDSDGDRHEIVLLTGSMVLPRLAWLRLRFGDGNGYSALFTRRRSGQATWHRLQLLWQQAHTTFGHPPGP